MSDAVASISIRRIALGALALLSVAAFTALSPSLAAATVSNSPLAYNGNCDRGEFCLGRYNDGFSGVFDTPGSDDKLTEHRFVPDYGTRPVNDNSWSVRNLGTSAPGVPHDVLVYNGYWRYEQIGINPGVLACVPQGRTGWRNLPTDLRDKISSFKWVSRATCNRYRQIR